MNLFNLFDIKPEEYQLVVVLQNDHACWFRWRGQELMGSWNEPMFADSLNQGSHCPWVLSDEGGAACRVRLVLDTSLDEVDRVKVDGLSNGWMNAVHCHSSTTCGLPAGQCSSVARLCITRCAEYRASHHSI